MIRSIPPTIQVFSIVFQLSIDQIPFLSSSQAMDYVSPILDVATCLWTCTSKRAAFVRELEGNLKTLKGTMEVLRISIIVELNPTSLGF